MRYLLIIAVNIAVTNTQNGAW